MSIPQGLLSKDFVRGKGLRKRKSGVGQKESQWIYKQVRGLPGSLGRAWDFRVLAYGCGLESMKGFR